MTETRKNFSLSGNFWLAIFSIISILFFWIPVILVISTLEEDDRRMGLIIMYSIPIQILMFVLTIKVLRRYIKFLKDKQAERFYFSVALRVLISLPSLAGGLAIIVNILFVFVAILISG